MSGLHRDLIHCAPLLARLAPPSDPVTLEALAFLVRNRASWLRDLPDFGDRDLRGAPAVVAVSSLDLPPTRPAADAETAFGALWAAFRGPGPDPTCGATHVHPHTETPVWAAELRATALIGPYLFLAPAPAPA